MTEIAGQLAILAKRVAARRISADDLTCCLRSLSNNVKRIRKAVA